MTALSAATIDDALTDPALLGAALGDGATWQTWRAVLKAAFGIALNREESRAFASVAGGRQPPGQKVRELWAIIGRRSGKSRVAALVACYIAAFMDHRDRLSAGEVGHVLVLAASKAQARVVFDYILGFFEASPILNQLVEDVRAEEVRLKGNIVLGVHPNNYRTVRGRTLLAVIFDEVAFWRDELSASPDIETYRAVLPALATTGGMLIGISSPYAQRGLLYAKHREHFGQDGSEVLVIQAETRLLNPTIDEGIIERARLTDPEAASAEWLAEFRGDLSSYVERTVVEQCVERGRSEQWPQRGVRYVAFVDMSGGQKDSSALAIAHREDEASALDLAREWKSPHSPADAVDEMCRTLREFRIVTVHGDRYAAGWATDEFRKHGIRYVPSERPKSQIYLDFLPLLTSRRAVLLEDKRLVNQFATLERRTVRAGRDSIDHMPGAVDDLANAAAGALTLAATGAAAREAPRSIVVEGASSTYDALSW